MDYLLVLIALCLPMPKDMPQKATPGRWAALKLIAKQTGVWVREDGWNDGTGAPENWMFEFQYVKTAAIADYRGLLILSYLPGPEATKRSVALARLHYTHTTDSLNYYGWLCENGVDRQMEYARSRALVDDAEYRKSCWERLERIHTRQHCLRFAVHLRDVLDENGGVMPDPVPMSLYEDVP